MLWLDLMTYLPDDILVKVDRMSMAHSLEVRSPLLDHRLIEYLAGLPLSYKVGAAGGTKKLLRHVAERYVPRDILRRPKHGFAIPLDRWFRGELREWLLDVLGSQSFRERGLFRPAGVQRLLDEHISGRRDRSQQLWALLVLEVWLQGAGVPGGAA